MQEMKEMQVRSLGQEDPLEKEMATCSSILAWEIPQTEQPSRLQSVELQRVQHDEVNEHACIHMSMYSTQWIQFSLEPRHSPQHSFFVHHYQQSFHCK